MSNNTTNAGGGIGLGAILFIVFLILKLTETIDWSWWWVTAPLWIPPLIVIGVVLIFGTIIAILEKR